MNFKKKIEEKDKQIADLTAKLKEPWRRSWSWSSGESGFKEINIEKNNCRTFQVAAVYFQGVDMILEGRQPSAAESDIIRSGYSLQKKKLKNMVSVQKIFVCIFNCKL